MNENTQATQEFVSEAISPALDQAITEEIQNAPQPIEVEQPVNT